MVENLHDTETNALIGGSLVKLANNNVNILGLSSSPVPTPNSMREYCVEFEYAVMDGTYKRWLKAAMPVRVPGGGTIAAAHIVAEVLAVVKAARGQLEA